MAKTLEKNGCHRLQKSVFVAPHMVKKDLVRLQLMLMQVFQRRPLKPGDSVYIMPLPQEHAESTLHFGPNNALPTVLEKKLKLLL